MELVNTHCHCVYSGHGTGTIAEYADAAAAAGLTTLAFTEHFPRIGNDHKRIRIYFPYDLFYLHNLFFRYYAVKHTFFCTGIHALCPKSCNTAF